MHGEKHSIHMSTIDYVFFVFLYCSQVIGYMQELS